MEASIADQYTSIQPSDIDRENQKGFFVFGAVLLGCGLLVGLAVYGLMAYREANFPHAIATITEVWTEKVRVSRGRGSLLVELMAEPKYKTVTMGRIKFVRTHKGISHDCDFVLQLGVPSDVFRVGERLDIVPATGTCQRADVIRRLD